MFNSIIPFLFNLMFFLVPLVFYSKSSELFEFNKMVLIYIFTILITAAWIGKMVISKKIIFKRTPLDLPILLFLLSQVLSTIFSIDPTTSIFGYYSRFNGGLLSTICYSLLYTSYVSNMNIKDTKKLINVMLFSGVIVGIYASLEHFGKSVSCLIITNKFDTACWIQDVKNRVFATVGQPNWLAAYIVAITPLTWALALNFQSIFKSGKYFFYHGLNFLFFCTLLFTKSRSGILGFIAAYLIFWALARNWKGLFLTTCYLLLATFLIGTPWTPALSELLNNKVAENQELSSGTSLESGGTESGAIRKIVWQGALQVWQHNPILGTGVETFAYSYFRFRPVEHNLTSEWDFLYNKAHNEFLNIAANTGTVGLLTYLLVVGVFIIYVVKDLTFTNYDSRKSTHKSCIIFRISLLAGFASLMVTNFFGFSVTLTSLQFFLFPAMAIALEVKGENSEVKTRNKLTTQQKTFFILSLLLASFLLLLTVKYWYADYLFAKGRKENDAQNFTQAQKYLSSAIVINPIAANYHDQLANSYSGIALELFEKNSKDLAVKFTRGAISESDTARSLSPQSTNLAKSRANLFSDLATIDPIYLDEAIKTLTELSTISPTDASVYHRIGLSLATLNKLEESIPYFQKAIELKSDYKNARQALSVVYSQTNKIEEAKSQLHYILENIAPNDEYSQSQLKNLESNKLK